MALSRVGRADWVAAQWKVCWGGNCQCGGVTTAGWKEAALEEKMRSSLRWRLLCLRGRLHISRSCLAKSLRSPFARQLCIQLSVSLFASSAPSACPVAPLPAHFQFSSISLLCSSWLHRSLSSAPWEAAASLQFNPPLPPLQNRPTISSVSYLPPPLTGSR